MINKKLLILSLASLIPMVGCNHGSSGGGSNVPPKQQPTSSQEPANNNTPPPSPTMTQPTGPLNLFEQVDEDVQKEINKLLQRNLQQGNDIYSITNNHQLSTLISKIIFQIDPDNPNSIPRLTLHTRGKDYKLSLVANPNIPPQPNHYDFAYVEDNTSTWDNLWNWVTRRKHSSRNQNPLFNVGVDIKHFDNKIMASMEIIGADPNDKGILNVIYLRKKGTLSIDKSSLTEDQLKNINNDPAAYHIYDLLQKNPTTIGEFYYMTTDPTSNATQFQLSISDNFSLQTDAAMSLANVLAQSNDKSLPLSIQNIHDFNFSMKDIDSADYEIMSRKIPIVLTHILLKLNIETSDDHNDNVPLKVLLNFP